MMWIGATPAQRNWMTMMDKKKAEAARCTSAYQAELSSWIKDAQQRLASKQAEQQATGGSRRLTRQIAEIIRELNEELLPNSRNLSGSSVDEFCNALRAYVAKR